MEITVMVTVTLDEEDISDILCTALEGGIGYWACLCNDEPSWQEGIKKVEQAGKTPYYDRIMWEVLKSGGSVRFQDAEDLEEGEIWDYNMDTFYKSVQLYEQKRGSLKKALKDGSFDAIEADIFIQYGLFGEIVFG